MKRVSGRYIASEALLPGDDSLTLLMCVGLLVLLVVLINATVTCMILKPNARISHGLDYKSPDGHSLILKVRTDLDLNIWREVPLTTVASRT